MSASAAARWWRSGGLAGKPGHEAARTVAVDGLFLAPGWVDLHSHADRSLVGGDMEERKAVNLVAQGITTVVMGADGRNPIWPIRDEIAAYESRGVGLNVVPVVGHSTVRLQVMGEDHERPATDEEVARMAELVREGMEDGAWGLGAGPEYRPARFSETGEIVALARVVADYDGFYYSHQRSQSPMPRWQVPSIVDGPTLTGTEGMAETIHIGRETGIRVVGTHIKAKGALELGPLGEGRPGDPGGAAAGSPGLSRPVPLRDLRGRPGRSDPRVGVRAAGNRPLRGPRRSAMARAGTPESRKPRSEPRRRGDPRRVCCATWNSRLTCSAAPTGSWWCSFPKTPRWWAGP